VSVFENAVMAYFQTCQSFRRPHFLSISLQSKGKIHQFLLPITMKTKSQECIEGTEIEARQAL
jgi:hypothetical protein